MDVIRDEKQVLSLAVHKQKAIEFMRYFTGNVVH